MTPEMRALFTGVEVLYLPIFILAVIVSNNPAPAIGAAVFTALVLLFRTGVNPAYLTGFLVSIGLQIFYY